MDVLVFTKVLIDFDHLGGGVPHSNFATPIVFQWLMVADQCSIDFDYLVRVSNSMSGNLNVCQRMLIF